MTDFEVSYRDMWVTVTSKVYGIDYLHDRLLIVDKGGHFMWVPIKECKLRRVDDDRDTVDNW